MLYIYIYAIECIIFFAKKYAIECMRHTVYIWRWDIKCPGFAKALQKAPKENQVPMIGHRFGHQSGQDESSGRKSTIL